MGGWLSHWVCSWVAEWHGEFSMKSELLWWNWLLPTLSLFYLDRSEGRRWCRQVRSRELWFEHALLGTVLEEPLISFQVDDITVEQRPGGYPIEPFNRKKNNQKNNLLLKSKNKASWTQGELYVYCGMEACSQLIQREIIILYTVYLNKDK